MLRQPYSYRDPHTMGAPETFFARVPRKQVYGWTGIQVMNFNSLFQLDTLRRNKDSALEAADKILFMPDALSYLLTGEMVTEYTIATTAQLVNAETRRLEPALLKEIGLTEEHFGRFVYPGEKVGVLTKEIQTITGLGAIPVIAVAGHDTASAVAAVPALDRNFAYLSSGTWSLMGVETDAPVINEETEALNFTNEGGVAGTIRLLKNICGMWLLERCRCDWEEISYPELIAEYEERMGMFEISNPRLQQLFDVLVEVYHDDEEIQSDGLCKLLQEKGLEKDLAALWELEMFRQQNPYINKIREEIDTKIIEVQIKQLDNEIKECLRIIQVSESFPEEAYQRYESLKKEKESLLNTQNAF